MSTIPASTATRAHQLAETIREHGIPACVEADGTVSALERSTSVLADGSIDVHVEWVSLPAIASAVARWLGY